MPPKKKKGGAAKSKAGTGVKDHENDGKKGKKNKDKKGKKDNKSETSSGGGKKGKKGKNKDGDEDDEDDRNQEGMAQGPKPKPITPEIQNPSLPDDKDGIERILKLVTIYDDPDWGGCTISGLLSSDIVAHSVKKTHMLSSVLEHKCTLVAKQSGRIIGICLCADRDDEEWENAWAHLKATFPEVADRDEILKHVYQGESHQAGRTVIIHQLAVDKNYRRMTVGTQLVKACIEKADDHSYHRVSILCTDAFSALICKKLKFKKQGEPLHYKKFNHPRTGRLIYKCIYKKPHKKMQHYALRFT